MARQTTDEHFTRAATGQHRDRPGEAADPSGKSPNKAAQNPTQHRATKARIASQMNKIALKKDLLF